MYHHLLRTPILAFVIALATLIGAARCSPLAPIAPDSDVADSKHNVTIIPSFNVTKFAAAAMVLSHRNYYKFYVAYDSSEAPVHCWAVGTTLGEDLSSLPQTMCGDAGNDDDGYDTGVSFQWVRKRDGSSALVVARQISDSVLDEAVYIVPRNDTPVLGQGKFRHQVYAGPENFTVKALRFQFY
ncbi:hypothetical protein B0T26DRAFT_630956 [Lasiosphaeria miniovina]|uniref:Uncharacterized protein n=1 Tax=Lasiosphaeria miniovina TaxID=1954250 RepID=A0AA40EGD5_9PEZI|nr:uncharacterized protein B0T26DRAFT_630956 [Lasiosphaeria miniovina]KAK0734373.1 hypothetical protein B0T26DRAFT_630956 [Lasiosphaeria miniovina]